MTDQTGAEQQNASGIRTGDVDVADQNRPDTTTDVQTGEATDLGSGGPDAGSAEDDAAIRGGHDSDAPRGERDDTEQQDDDNDDDRDDGPRSEARSADDGSRDSDENARGSEEVAAEIASAYGDGRAASVQVDVTDEAAVAEMMRQTVLAFGGIDILVASAGLATSAPVTETTVDEWERNHAVLVRGYFLAAREVFRVLMAQGRGGAIVFVGSKNALVAGANATAYSSAKAASLHLARCLAEEGGEHGIRVNTVNPDAVIEGSGIWSSEWKAERASTYGVAEEELPAFYRSRTTLDVNVYAEDVAEAIAFLASERAAKSTGNVVNVDGGFSAAYPR